MAGNGRPEKFRTSDHRWFRDEQPDGTTAYRKDGRFAREEDYDRAFLFAHTDVNIPDPDTGEPMTVTVLRSEASALGVIANDPEEGETLTVDTIDGELIEIPHQMIADHFSQIEGEGKEPVRYLT